MDEMFSFLIIEPCNVYICWAMAGLARRSGNGQTLHCHGSYVDWLGTSLVLAIKMEEITFI